MLRYLLRLAVFLAPLWAAWFYVEVRLRHLPVVLTKKRDLLEQRGPGARVLVLGSSMEYEDISPKQFECGGLNVATAAQSLFLDNEIMQRFVGRLPQLRLVILGVPYGAFEGELGDSYLSQLIYAYWHYFGTRLDGGVSYWDARTFSLIATYGQEAVVDLILNGFQVPPMMSDPTMDEDGWLPVPVKGTFGVTNEPLARWDLNFYHSFLKLEHIPENVRALEELLTLLRERGVEAVFIGCPVAPALAKQADPARIERTRSAIAALQARFGVTYMDYSRDPRFTNEDFADLDHLIEGGAIKFSQILNEEVIRPRGVCADAVH